ncbi:tannase/feruloyl esterase family alpha/beta hydrolase [Acidovorax sp.]|uniref:tannase/feruloyl esterase family alpha/beta hydrolase n=1 Tax=Acidovorax sp. TaxID=1872122 RepID=UPI002ACDFA9A|nr:tannase/feruloyl esterase family alpha/beta hydrolase [Acidovorax sp.]MDZ7864337.1 tannase/feruloyl esterase family alpha/beta hydrolase [Acidovorax sp.]
MFSIPPTAGTASGRPALLAATLTALALTACGGSDSSAPAASQPLAQACPTYRTATLPHGATITRTELRAAEGLLPEVCIVRGEIVSSPQSTIHWAVELPAGTVWNGKTLTVGGGAFDGFIPTDDPWYQHIIGASAQTYVKMSSDSGHLAPGFAWGASDVALRNHAFDANHFVLEVGTAIASDFYGKRPTRRYHIGHSNGGRSALAATQNYPKDYDGVVAMEPAISQQAHQANLGPTLLRHVFSKPENWLSPAKIALYARAETAACDALDGLADGIIGNVAACNYVPTELLCKGADSDSCLTAGQIESVRLIYAQKDVPVTLSQGARGYPGFGRGGAATSDWEAYVFGPSFEARDSFNYMAVSAAARLVEGNPAADLLQHDPTRYQASYLRLANMIDATNPDISAFADNGGKLLIWYGMGDACVSVYRTAEYLDSVRQRLGASKVQGFARMLTSPSNGHNLDGPGTDPVSIDLLAAMDAWVERGTAPDRLVATRYEPADPRAGRQIPVLQRPVCEYPKFPRFDGKGDPAKAESFSCSAV